MPEVLAQRVVETPTIVSNEQKVEKSPEILVPESKELKATEYEHIKHQPLVADILEIGQALEHLNMKDLTKEINDFVLSEIERNKLEDTEKSYREVVEEYSKRMNLPKGASIYAKTERIAELMRLDKKLLDIIAEKKELEQKDFKDLTSRQMLERMGL